MKTVAGGIKEFREVSILEPIYYQSQETGVGVGLAEGSALVRWSVVALLCRPELMAENAVIDWTP